MGELNYVLNLKGLKLSLNLYEAERYENAVLVQPLIGNLVVYSNQGRYTPLLAESWTVDKDGNWSFKLKKGLTCDDGEPITPETFKKSIELSITHLSKTDNVPIFSKLKGYSSFVKGDTHSIEGIEALEDHLNFNFAEPTRSGVIESLSFAPFGFICSGNRNSDGTWKDDLNFISSGPYRVVTHLPGQKHVLELRDPWAKSAKKAPTRLSYYFSYEEVENKSNPTIIDSFTVMDVVPSNLKRYKLVPEYLNPIILSPTSDGRYFSRKENRILLKKAIEVEKSKLPVEIDNHSKSDFYYQNQPPKNPVHESITDTKIEKPTYPLRIQGKEPLKGDKKYLNWVVLKGALDSLGFPHVFDNSGKTFAERVNNRFDIRFLGSAIGGGAQAWGVAFQFCSEIGPKFPDPSGSICKAVKEFDEGRLDEKQFVDEFNQRVFDDVTVIPITHYGIVLYLSPEISQSSLSPLVSVFRFEQLEIE